MLRDARAALRYVMSPPMTLIARWAFVVVGAVLIVLLVHFLDRRDREHEQVTPLQPELRHVMARRLFWGTVFVTFSVVVFLNRPMSPSFALQTLPKPGGLAVWVSEPGSYDVHMVVTLLETVDANRFDYQLSVGVTPIESSEGGPSEGEVLILATGNWAVTVFDVDRFSNVQVDQIDSPLPRFEDSGPLEGFPVPFDQPSDDAIVFRLPNDDRSDAFADVEWYSSGQVTTAVAPIPVSGTVVQVSGRVDTAPEAGRGHTLYMLPPIACRPATRHGVLIAGHPSWEVPTTAKPTPASRCRISIAGPSFQSAASSVSFSSPARSVPLNMLWWRDLKPIDPEISIKVREGFNQSYETGSIALDGRTAYGLAWVAWELVDSQEAADAEAWVSVVTLVAGGFLVLGLERLFDTTARVKD